MAQLVTDYMMRPVEARDEQAVLTLVNADQVPGQPLATSAMLAEALAGRSGGPGAARIRTYAHHHPPLGRWLGWSRSKASRLLPQESGQGAHVQRRVWAILCEEA